jgi:DeoR family transcriptional regulator of aga operon
MLSAVFAEERHRWIVTRVHALGSCHVEELASRLSLSAVTIRRDLHALEDRGLLRRTRGGAFALPQHRLQTSGRGLEATLRIAEVAAELVADGSAVALANGPEALALALVLRSHARRLTVVTNAIDIAALLADAPSITTHVTGGTLLAGRHALVNPFAAEILTRLRVEVCFLGASGVDGAGGVTAACRPEAQVKRQFLDAARRRVLLAGSRKLGRVAGERVAGLEELDALVTDRDASLDQLAALRALGLEIHLA